MKSFFRQILITSLSFATKNSDVTTNVSMKYSFWTWHNSRFPIQLIFICPIIVTFISSVLVLWHFQNLHVKNLLKDLNKFNFSWLCPEVFSQIKPQSFINCSRAQPLCTFSIYFGISPNLYFLKEMFVQLIGLYFSKRTTHSKKSVSN